MPRTPTTRWGRLPNARRLVLGALILVAAVANLNLSVANVALPDIGRPSTRRRRAQPHRGRLFARAGRVGALPRRARRPLRAQADAAARHGAAVPACLLAAFAPNDEVLFVARVIGGLSAGMAYPTTLALITALWSGPGAHEVDRPVVGARRRDRVARPAGRRRPARALLVGLGLPHHPAARRGRLSWRCVFVPGPRERDHRAGRQPRRHRCPCCWSAR